MSRTRLFRIFLSVSFCPLLAVLADDISDMQAAKSKLRGSSQVLQKSIDKIEAPEEKVLALAKIASDQNEGVNERLAALALLGRFETDASVETLIENVSLRSYPATDSIAMKSLREIGESSLPKIFAAVKMAIAKKKSDEERDLVFAIYMVVAPNETKWLAENVSSLEPEVRDAVLRYSATW